MFGFVPKSCLHLNCVYIYLVMLLLYLSPDQKEKYPHTPAYLIKQKKKIKKTPEEQNALITIFSL